MFVMRIHVLCLALTLHRPYSQNIGPLSILNPYTKQKHVDWRIGWDVTKKEREMISIVESLMLSIETQ
jgi:hypothetical protein